MTPEEIKDILKLKLKQTRYNHSLGVADTAKELALRFGADPYKAYMAGLVHDCAKGYTNEELMDKIRAYGIELDECTLSSPQLLHSLVGAYELKDLYGICDDEIYDAVYYHTVGKKDMPLLTAIVYLADAIEPSREYPGVDEVRQQALTSLEKAVYLYTRRSVDYILERGFKVHPNAYEILDFYERK